MGHSGKSRQRSRRQWRGNSGRHDRRHCRSQACAPILMGFGALPGALAGAYLGCLAMELLKGKPWEMAVKAAKGTLMGRFLGALCKCGAGLTIVLLTARALLGNTQV